MSHISTCKLMVSDLDAFDAACRSLGLDFKRGQKSHRTYAGAQNDCEHAVTLHGCEYELGLVRATYDEASGELKQDANGSAFMVNYDSWAGGDGMMDVVGKDCNKLLQAYGVEAAKAKARQLGMAVKVQTLQDGSVKLTCTCPDQQMGTVQQGW